MYSPLADFELYFSNKWFEPFVYIGFRNRYHKSMFNQASGNIHLMLDIHCAVLVLVSDENIFLNWPKFQISHSQCSLPL